MKKVLIVEDEVPLRDALQELIEKKGYSCSIAGDGSEGLHKAFSEKPDLIVLDIMMPGKDGFSMLRELRDDAWGVAAKVLVLTNSPATAENSVRSTIETVPECYIEKAHSSIYDIVERIELLTAS